MKTLRIGSQKINDIEYEKNSSTYKMNMEDKYSFSKKIKKLVKQYRSEESELKNKYYRKARNLASKFDMEESLAEEEFEDIINNSKDN